VRKSTGLWQQTCRPELCAHADRDSVIKVGYVAAFEPLLEQAKEEPGTLLYALHRSKDDPYVFWTTEVYADDAAFAAHSVSEVHAAAPPVFTELIAAADVLSSARH
jgi:quinol monooxygenase YgiN